MTTVEKLGSGLIGACAVTAIHETMRRVVPEAPRMDLMGMNAVSRALSAAGVEPPRGKKLYNVALVGDLLSNALYYSLAGYGSRKQTWTQGAALGLAAGIGAVAFPPAMGLDGRHSARTWKTGLLTVGLYVTGALISTAMIKLLQKHHEKREQKWRERLITSAIS